MRYQSPESKVGNIISWGVGLSFLALLTFYGIREAQNPSYVSSFQCAAPVIQLERSNEPGQILSAVLGIAHESYSTKPTELELVKRNPLPPFSGEPVWVRHTMPNRGLVELYSEVNRSNGTWKLRRDRLPETPVLAFGEVDEEAGTVTCNTLE
jgi:hypothetical protein